jgi:hypothetical protein
MNDMNDFAFLTPEKIHKSISSKLANGVGYVEALCDYSRENDLEIETVAEIVRKSDVLVHMIATEAYGTKMLKADYDNGSGTKEFCWE